MNDPNEEALMAAGERLDELRAFIEGERGDEIEDLRKAVRKRGATISELYRKVDDARKTSALLRVELHDASARVPSTPEEALTLAWELACPVPEGQKISAGTPLIERWSDGDTVSVPAGSDVDLPATSGHVERRTLAPLPASRPRHAEVIGGVLIAEAGMHDDDARDTADKIARAIEEQEGQDDDHRHHRATGARRDRAHAGN